MGGLHIYPEDHGTPPAISELYSKLLVRLARISSDLGCRSILEVLSYRHCESWSWSRTDSDQAGHPVELYFAARLPRLV